MCWPERDPPIAALEIGFTSLITGAETGGAFSMAEVRIPT